MNGGRFIEYQFYTRCEETGEYIDIRTGELVGAQTIVAPAGSTVQTPADKEREKMDKELRREQYRVARIEGEKRRRGADANRKHLETVRNGIGNFVGGSNDGMELDPADITNLMLIATYLVSAQGVNQGFLMWTSRTRMIKEQCMKVLDMGRSSFYAFWSRLIDGGYVEERKDGIRILRNFWYGATPSNVPNGWTRIFKERYRELYRALPKSRRKLIGLLFLSLKYLHPKYNVLCQYPLEQDITQIKPMSFSDLLDVLSVPHTDSRTVAGLKGVLTDTSFGDSKEKFCAVADIWGNRQELIIINPKVWYKGSWAKVKNDPVVQLLFAQFD